eukprot:SM000128S26246  [mRNA]  locus=s128:390531:391396:+ [translate_table: standard]
MLKLRRHQFRATCLQDREGRHYCAYNSSQGYRAIGAGYALDRDVEERKRELSGVYEGKECLNDLQINALLALDARRYLNYAYKAAHALDDWCCEVQAVFAELAFAAGDALEEDKDFKEVIEKASSRKWEAAADVLKDTAWCEENEKRTRNFWSRAATASPTIAEVPMFGLTEWTDEKHDFANSLADALGKHIMLAADEGILSD